MAKTNTRTERQKRKQAAKEAARSGNAACVPPGYLPGKLEFGTHLQVETRSHQKMFAIIGTWHEADIIEATVKNCFANGCDKVFILDNDSRDDTVAVALAAGAELAGSYTTKHYDDDKRVLLMNEFMHATTIKLGEPRLWWLTLDADEFPVGPEGQTLKEYLSWLHPEYAVIGAKTVDLYPTTQPHYVSGKHPADYQSHGISRIGRTCRQNGMGHWKHPLLLFKDGKPSVAQYRGLHIPFTNNKKNRNLVEVQGGVYMFHAPYRTKEMTTSRLNLLCEKNENHDYRASLDDKVLGNQGAIKRWQTLEAVYSGDWKNVEIPHSQVFGRDVTGITLYPWKKFFPELESFPRWYSIEKPQPTQTRRPLELVS